MAAARRVVLVTASSAGLGAQIARAFAPDYRVRTKVINYSSNHERADALLQELKAIPRRSPGTDQEEDPPHMLVRADMADRVEVGQLVRETVAKMGRLDVVVSNAGWTRLTDFGNLDANVDDADWARCFAMNVQTHLWLMHAALPALAETSGAFVSTASAAGVRPGGSSLAYSVTKAAQIQLARCLAVIVGKQDVRVNSVSPGLLLTEWGLRFPEAKRAAAVTKTKLGRLATVEDVAAQVKTLAESQSTTGQNICIDGGSTV